MGVTTVRATALDIVPSRPLARAAVVTGRAADLHDDVVLREIEFRAQIDDDGLLARWDSDAALPDGLLGATTGAGFRRSLAPLGEGGPSERLLRRMLWDLPILSQVAGQTALLDHSGARADVVLSRRGTDQCSGWRAGGEMFDLADRDGGVLRMPLGPVADQRSIAAPYLRDVGDLPPMATRRSRLLTVGAGAGGSPQIVLAHRDTYADPDGVARRLHEWTAHTSLDDLGRFGPVRVEAGRLPWVECPVAGLSGGRLEGRRPAEVEADVRDGFHGISTCTHLNDALRGLAEVGDLLDTSAAGAPADR